MKYIYINKKLRHLFTKKLYFGFFQTFKGIIYIPSNYIYIYTYIYIYNLRFQQAELVL